MESTVACLPQPLPTAGAPSSLPKTAVHLLCLWIATAGVSLQQLRRATEACAAGGSLGIQILAQAFVGFLLASLVAYLGEARLRRRFLKSRQAAACLVARQKHAGLPPTAPVAHGGGGGS